MWGMRKRRLQTPKKNELTILPKKKESSFVLMIKQNLHFLEVILGIVASLALIFTLGLYLNPNKYEIKWQSNHNYK